jgi:hypothetical protein
MGGGEGGEKEEGEEGEEEMEEEERDEEEMEQDRMEDANSMDGEATVIPYTQLLHTCSLSAATHAHTRRVIEQRDRDCMDDDNSMDCEAFGLSSPARTIHPPTHKSVPLPTQPRYGCSYKHLTTHTHTAAEVGEGAG